MTEEQWLAATDPYWMLENGENHISACIYRSRYKLFCVGCCRLVWPQLTDQQREAVEAAERHALGELLDDDYITAMKKLIGNRRHNTPWTMLKELVSCVSYSWPKFYRTDLNAAQRARATFMRIRRLDTIRPAPDGTNDPRHPWHSEIRLAIVLINRELEGLIRCLLGNPFREVVVSPGYRTPTGTFDLPLFRRTMPRALPLVTFSDWSTSTVTSIAAGIYADRAFDRLPILADALEEAGCDDADILTHCRGDGQHVRGCWVVDAVLGKK